MTRGYCAVCDRLVLLEARGWSPCRTRQRWYPVRHARLGDDSGGADCPGVEVAL